jgi:putative tryptophan/tyrosine transport system substrate-binding protein
VISRLVSCSLLARSWRRRKQRRIAIVEADFAATIDDPRSRLWQPFWSELHRLGDVEGQNLVIRRYAGEGRPEGYDNLARQVVADSPDVIVAVTDPITQSIHAANGANPIVLIGGDVVEAGLATSLARPGGNITGVDVYPGDEIWGKLLQILKEAVPLATKVALLGMGDSWSEGQRQVLQDASQRLQISLTPIPLQESTPSEYQRAFAEMVRERVEAIMVHARGELLRHRELIVKSAKKTRLPAIYPWREYGEAGGLIAYASDFREFGRRMANDVHEIVNWANPGEAAKAIGITIPPTLLGRADEVIE